MRTAAVFALILVGCTHEVRVPYPVREYVTPKCEVPNTFERCKEVCLKDGKRPTDSWEDGSHFECNCANFDALNWKAKGVPAWVPPGPRKPARRSA